MTTEPLPDPSQGFPYARGVLSTALDNLIAQQRNLLELLAQHNQERANPHRTEAVLASIRETGAQIVDVNGALWTLEERGK